MGRPSQRVAPQGMTWEARARQEAGAARSSASCVCTMSWPWEGPGRGRRHTGRGLGTKGRKCRKEEGPLGQVSPRGAQLASPQYSQAHLIIRKLRHREANNLSEVSEPGGRVTAQGRELLRCWGLSPSGALRKEAASAHQRGFQEEAPDPVMSTSRVILVSGPTCPHSPAPLPSLRFQI